jgi:prevent-host-death family protein
MERRLSIQDARRQLPTIVQSAYYRGDRTLIARHGKPMAAVMSIEEYERWKQYRDQALVVFDRIWEANKQAKPSQVERDVEEAVRQVRRKRRRR